MVETKPSVISLFTGAMGLDLGLEQAGFDTRVAVECNQFAVKTIQQNRPDIPVIGEKIEGVTAKQILEKAGLGVNEPTVVTGGPSCQPFSNAGQRQSVADPRGSLFREFIRIVHDTRPEFFVMENVRGILSAALKHRPLNERGPGYPHLLPEEELGSAFLIILEEFEALGYYTVFDLVNAADYGVPQSRERLIFIGSRDGKPVTIPKPTHAKVPTPGLSSWVSLKAGLDGLSLENLVYKDFSEKVKTYLSLLSAGENWHNLPEEMKEEAIGRAYHSWGGRSGFLRRLSWERPSPTLTTDPNGRATMLCHPDEVRPLSVQEYARLQQFPDNWEFNGSSSQQYIQVGNAVPVGLGKAIGEAILKAREGTADPKLLGQVLCPNKSLLDRMSRCTKTRLNPPRMRQSQKPEDLKLWLNGLQRDRKELLRFGLQKTLDFAEASDEK